MIRSYYRCCCINEPFSHCVHLKLGHRFHALLKVCSDRDNTVPLSTPNLDSWSEEEWFHNKLAKYDFVYRLVNC